MKVYPYIYEGYTIKSEEEAIKEFQQIVDCHYVLDEAEEQNIKYSKFIDSYKDYELYYDYGADYYFISDKEDK